MKKYYSIIVLLLFSCNKKIETEELQKLNGYWQIEKVTFSNGQEKQFNNNPALDYIEINDSLKGFKVKVVPTATEKFLTNGIKENFTITKNKLYYKTHYTAWVEEIIVLNDSVFSVKNNEGKQYTYKKLQIQ